MHSQVQCKNIYSGEADLGDGAVSRHSLGSNVLRLLQIGCNAANAGQL